MAAEQRHHLETMLGGHADIAPVLYEINEIPWSELGLSDLLKPNKLECIPNESEEGRGETAHGIWLEKSELLPTLPLDE